MTIQITGITCEACTKLIAKRLRNLVGVQDVQVALSGETQIATERPIEVQEIRQALAGTPYSL